MSASNDHAAHEEYEVHAHVSSAYFLWAIFLGLIFLTFVTVAVSYVDLGPANLFVAVLVATMKASLVSVFFMHLRHDKPFHSLIFVSSFVFLGIFIAYTLNDLDTRAEVDRANGNVFYDRAGLRAPGGLPPEAYEAQHAPAGAAHGEGHGEGHAAPAAAEHH